MELSKTKETSISKFLSLVLRHKPEEIGIVLDNNGWADVNELISKSKQKFSFEELDYVVKNNLKQRFSFNDDLTKIRANQGHSIKIDLKLKPQKPPDILYHGTALKNLESIKKQGLLKQQRQFVHLSADYDTAYKVGMRYGKPIVLKIDSGKMFNEGYPFFLSENGVWLIDHIPTGYIKQ